MANSGLDGDNVPLAIRLLKQPSTDEEETRQAKQEKHRIKSQQGIAQTEVADMRIDHEDHRESPHRINVFYPLFWHYACKDTELSSISWIFRKNIVLLSYEREINMD